MALEKSGYFEVEVIETVAHRFQVKADMQDDAVAEVRRLTQRAEADGGVTHLKTIVHYEANPLAQSVKSERLGYSLNRATPLYKKSE